MTSAERLLPARRCGHRVRVGLDADGNIAGWDHRIAAPTDPERHCPSKSMLVHDGVDHSSVEGVVGSALPVSLASICRPYRHRAKRQPRFCGGARSDTPTPPMSMEVDAGPWPPVLQAVTRSNSASPYLAGGECRSAAVWLACLKLAAEKGGWGNARRRTSFSQAYRRSQELWQLCGSRSWRSPATPMTG